MSDTNETVEQNIETPEVENPTVEPETPNTDDAENGDEPLGEPGKKALISEREARKAAEKELAETKARLHEYEAANMSDLEKAQAAAAEAQANAEKAATEALRLRIAIKHNISEEDADLFLNGTDEATLEAQAARLAERTASTPTPKPDLTQGAKGSTLTGDAASDFAAALDGLL